MLKDADEWNRLTAARLLLEQGDLSGRPVLVNALSSPDIALRLEAARLAGRFLTHDEAWRLEDLLSDSLDNVRLYAVQAAGQLRTSELLPQLKAILEEKRAGGYDLTAAAAEAIAAIGTGEAVSILREALKSEQFVTRLCAAVELIRLEQERNDQAKK
jgi:HEAT repeat protein